MLGLTFPPELLCLPPIGQAWLEPEDKGAQRQSPYRVALSESEQPGGEGRADLQGHREDIQTAVW